MALSQCSIKQVTPSPGILLQGQNPMGDFTDRQLLELVLEAQGHPLHSPERQRSLTRLVIEIKRSGRLDRLRRFAPRYSPSLFQDLYNEALQEMYMYICHKVDLYRPDHPVMAWVNNTLRCKFLDVVKQHQFHEMPYEPILFEQLFSTARNDDQPRLDYDSLRCFLETDPEGLLRSYSSQKQPIVTFQHPTVTFQFLAIARHIQGKTWEEIERETGISFKTLASFFTRTLQKLLPYFQKYL